MAGSIPLPQLLLFFAAVIILFGFTRLKPR